LLTPLYIENEKAVIGAAFDQIIQLDKTRPKESPKKSQVGIASFPLPTVKHNLLYVLQ
jgi:hypothetical protein